MGVPGEGHVPLVAARDSVAMSPGNFSFFSAVVLTSLPSARPVCPAVVIEDGTGAREHSLFGGADPGSR